jgi:hypothetical protein
MHAARTLRPILLCCAVVANGDPDPFADDDDTAGDDGDTAGDDGNTAGGDDDDTGADELSFTVEVQ